MLMQKMEKLRDRGAVICKEKAKVKDDLVAARAEICDADGIGPFFCARVQAFVGKPLFGQWRQHDHLEIYDFQVAIGCWVQPF